VLDPWEAASVADYRGWALAAAAATEARGRRVLFVGGTALYLKALLRGLFEGPAADPALRRALEDEAERSGDAALHARLERVDPASARRIHPNDRRRVVRALEVFAATGRPLSDLQREHDQPAPGVAVFALQRPRAVLCARIDRRVEAMFAAGLVDEVRALLAAPGGLGAVPAQGVGYREVIELLAGRQTLEAAVALVQARTRQFAKRQATWFRSLAEVEAWPVEEDEPPEATADRLAARLGRPK
jgi:tRNA dimethylallyltransferase